MIPSKRKKRSFVSVMAVIVFLIFFIPFSIAHDLWSKNATEEIVSVIFAVFVALFLWCETPVKKYREAVKKEIFPRIFDFFDYLQYSFNVDVEWQYLQDQSHIIPYHHSKELRDHVCGHIDDVALEMFQACLTKQEGSGKRQKTVTVFEGFMISLSMNKKFSGKTIVTKDAGKFGNFFKEKIPDLENVKLESSEFEKMFEVYSCDQVEARYILTTSFMERIIELSSALNADVQCSFFDDSVLILLGTSRKLFEISSIHEPVNFKNDAYSVIAEITILKEIVDILKLNQKTGL